MTHGALTYVRALLAFAVGVGIDLILSADAYAYGERFHHQNLIGINVFWLMLLLPFVCSLTLEFKWRHPGGGSPTLAALDSRGLLIPSAIVIGLTVTHTIVLIRDMMIDPTTHNLAPFEYLFAWITVGIPALAGSMLARAISWTVSRLRVQ